MPDNLPNNLVLIVDDEPLVLDFMAHALAEAGFQVRSELGSDEAMAVLELNRARELVAVVTDINLGRGKLTGWEIAKHARELRPDLPIIYVTGDSAHEWASHGVPQSVLLMKPFAEAQVVTAVAASINEHQQHSHDHP